MALKKSTFAADEIAIYEDAVVYLRGNYWQMRMWLAKERKYARFSLKTQSRETAIDKAKRQYHVLMAQQEAGRTYFSKTCKQGVEAYLEQRLKDVEAELIVKGRYNTIKTHLEHWLDFRGRDTKLKELQRTDCEDYYYTRSKTNRNLSVSQVTVANEQSTINAMMSWLFKRNETYIDAFDFKKFKRIDKGAKGNRRDTFTDAEVVRLKKALDAYIAEAEGDITGRGNWAKAVTGYYLGVALITGLRRGEQLQLRWTDIEDTEHEAARKGAFELIKIRVRGKTSKVRKTREFVVTDSKYFNGVYKLTMKRFEEQVREVEHRKRLGDDLIFSLDGKTAITAKMIGYHFNALLERAKVEDRTTRDLVPYSLRHYFITQRVNSSLTPTAVAEICGTSITQIEKTYYHTTFEKMISNALADYEYKNGLLIIK